MDWSSWKWRDADVLIFNTGHWWNYEKTLRGDCYFQEGEEVKVDMRVDDAYVNTSKTQVFFRTFSPVHFRGGDWRNGGTCHKETLPELGLSSSSLVPSENWAQYKIISDVLSANSDTSEAIGLSVLNITLMTSSRKDGHSSFYYQNTTRGRVSKHRQDCSHWCLPGVPDSWNELLFAVFMKREAARLRNATIHLAQIRSYGS